MLTFELDIKIYNKEGEHIGSTGGNYSGSCYSIKKGGGQKPLEKQMPTKFKTGLNKVKGMIRRGYFETANSVLVKVIVREIGNRDIVKEGEKTYSLI